MGTKTQPFDIAAHLKTTDEIRAFLQEVAETGDETDFIHAVSVAARASLYKSLAEDGNPRFETISKIIKSLGCKLAVV